MTTDHDRGISRRTALLAGGLAALAGAARAEPGAAEPRGTGDLGLIVERARGSLLLVETTGRTVLARIAGLGDLSHASITYGRSGRFAYVFGRDGGLTKVDLLRAAIAGRVIQAGNAIGGAISQDGRIIAVCNYDPGGVRLFDAENLAPLGRVDFGGKAVGLADVPGQGFIAAAFESGDVFLIDAADPLTPRVQRFPAVGAQPYDGVLTGDGRHYFLGLFGEDAIVRLDLWDSPPVPRKILGGYRNGVAGLPVYKMPHLQGWTLAGDTLFLPAVGAHEVLLVETGSFTERGRVPLRGQPVFAVAQPDGRRIWVNFAPPHNGFVQIVDVPTRTVVAEIETGPAALHLEFTPRGEQVWISVRDGNRVDIVNPRTLEKITSLPADKPSGIFFTHRANRIGL